MGIYTTININDKEGQVKLWNDFLPPMSGATVRTDVPSYEGNDSYAVAMREGGFVLIYDCKIIA